MRKLMNYKALVAVMVIALAMGACKKSSDDAAPEITPTMSATIADIAANDSLTALAPAQWNAFLPTASIIEGKPIIYGTSADIAKGLTQDVITITVGELKEGTYTIGLATLSFQCICTLQTVYNGKWSTFGATSGSVTLSKVDTVAKRISGTFEFTLYSGVLKTIQEGKFENLKY